MNFQRLPDPNWRPINTAPKDGSYVLLLSQDGDETGVVMASWDDPRGWRCWSSGDIVSGTHWMPVPEPPMGERPESVRVSPAALHTSFAVEQRMCSACGHQHADASLGGICIGCPCDEVRS